jgi:beta-1,4-N-acetylglucosaminyltransferase
MVAVLGSGGHTREMLGLLRIIDPKLYTHRTYIASSGDGLAQKRAFEIESNIQSNVQSSEHTTLEGELSPNTGVWDFKVVRRAREIHQPIYTTPISAIRSLMACMEALNETARSSKVAPMEYPDVIVTNGPATAVMVILASLILRFLGVAPVWKMKVIFVESWARVNNLSLSGKILLCLGVCDAFIVQWTKLADKINGTGKRKKVVYMECIVK